MSRILPYLAFVLSGASSLIFQSLWSRMLHHVFGSTSVAISTVLSAFMAGLGLGAWLAGKYAHRIKHPLITYAVLELIIGGCALVIPFLVDATGFLASVNQLLRASFDPEGFGMILARFFCVAPILLVPTTLMGATLPLLSQHFVRAADDTTRVSAQVGVLYAVNTAGAVAGTLLGGFVFLPNIGLAASNIAALSMNFLLAALIFAFRKELLGDTWKAGERLRWWIDEDSAPATPSVATAAPVESRDDSAIPIPRVARWAAFIAFAGSGMAALAYEVVWSRALAMTLGSSIQTFSLILATFLTGIAGGSALAAGLMERTAARIFVLGAESVVLAMVAAAPWGVAGGLGTWIGVTMASILPIAVIVASVRARSRSTAAELAPDDVVPGLGVLAIPVVVAGLGAVIYHEDGPLAVIVAAVVALLASTTAVLLVLRRYAVLQLAVVQLGIGVATFVNYLFQDKVPYAFAKLVTTLPDLPEHVGTVRFFMFLTAFLCILPSTIGMGAMFPLAIRVWNSSGGRSIARDVAIIYTGNTVGSIIGAWLPGFVLFQAIGAERTILVGIILNLVLALGLLIAGASDDAAEAKAPTPPTAEAEDTKKKGAKGAKPPAAAKDADAAKSAPPAWHTATIYVLAPLVPALVAVVILGGWYPNGWFRWNRAHMTLGVFRVSLAQDVLDPASWGEPDIVYYHDGLSTTVTVERWGRHYALKNNGKVDASNGDDMPTQIMVAMFPLLMHQGADRPLDVAVIGFGSGVTVGSALQFPDEWVGSVDVVELERSIPEASKFFQDVNHLEYPHDAFPYVAMPRLTVINDDGRNYLASTDRKFDIIMSEPSNPWITGVADLFTTDHFAISKRSLRPGGIYCQWVQLYELSPENIKTIFRTFASQFRHVVVFAAEDLSSDTVILGSDEPLPLDLERVSRAFTVPSVAEELERAYVHSPFDVFARVLLANRDEVLEYTQIEHRREGDEWVMRGDSSNGAENPCEPPNCRREPVELNTYDNALIEFAAPNDLIGFARYEGYLANIYSADWPFGRLSASTSGFGEGPEGARNRAEMAMSLIGHGRKAEAGEFIRAAHELGSARETLVAAEVLRLLLSGEHEPTIALEPPIPGPDLERDAARQLAEGFAEVRRHVDSRSYAAALAAMEDIPAPLRLHSGPSLRFLYGFLLYRAAEGQASRYQEAIEQLEDIARNESEWVGEHPELYYFLARAHDAEYNYDKALRNMRLYVEARLVPTEASNLLPEPAAGTTPTTDEPGETIKDTNPDHT